MGVAIKCFIIAITFCTVFIKETLQSDEIVKLQEVAIFIKATPVLQKILKGENGRTGIICSLITANIGKKRDISR